MSDVAALPADKQIEAVAKKLEELNPGFDGKVTGYSVQGTPKIENGLVTEFGFATNNVTDISPVRALVGLKKLTCGGVSGGQGKLSDLSPLAGMPLTDLECGHTQVADLSPLKGLKLTVLNCADTNVSDLSPLNGMPLVKLTLDGTQVDDLSPLEGMKLSDVTITPRNIRVGLEVLRRMPSLQKLRSNPTDAAFMPKQFWKRYDAGEFSGTPVGTSFFEFDGRNGFWGGPGVPSDAFKLLSAVRVGNKGDLKCFAFKPDGDWVFLFGSNGFSTSNANLPAYQKLVELQKQTRTDFKCVAFAPDGGWTILWNQNGNWTQGSVPDKAFKKMQEVVKGGGTLRSIAYGPGGAWVLLFDESGVWYGDVPSDLAKVLDNAVKKGIPVLCVDFTGSDWICLASGGWWTSNVYLPAAKLIEKNIKQGYSPKWIAVEPTLGK